MSADDICGAPTTRDRPCQNPAGSCPIEAHEQTGEPPRHEDDRTRVSNHDLDAVRMRDSGELRWLCWKCREIHPTTGGFRDICPNERHGHGTSGGII